ncbi:MAG: efflux RND transporter permease subunit [Pseudomonadota bacterium]
MSGAPSSSGGGLIGWFAGNAVTANLLMLFMLIGGLAVAGRMQAEAFPEIDPGTITVTVAYRGATPEEVEDAITRRVEEAVIGIDGVDRVRSSASEGAGVVTLELKDFVDSQLIKDDVEAAVDSLVDFPPAEAEQPRIVIVEPPAEVMRLAVFGDVSELDLREAAEQIEADILEVDEVAQVSLLGARAREISIEVSEETLRRYGLTLQRVADRVRAASVDLSGGTLRTSGGEILLRTNEERRTGEAFETIVVASDPTGRELRLGDIATVTDAFEDAELLNTFRGAPAVFLAIDKADDQDAFDVSGAVTALLDDYAPTPGIAIEVVSDSTTVIADRLNLLIRNSVMGLALVVIFLALTLDLRLAFWVSLGILVAFLGAFIAINSFVSINMVTLFGLIIVLGLVVDDAIVVGENIYEEQQKGLHGREAAIKGVLGVAAPVTIGVLTTMAAFAPLLFSTGQISQILFPVPVVVIAVLAASLLEAFFILPAHLSHGRDWSVGLMARARAAGQGALAFMRDRIFMPVIRASMRWRYLSASIMVAYVIILVSFPASGALRFVFFPSIEADQVQLSLEMPEGVAFERTEAVMERLVEAAYVAVGGPESTEFESLSVTIGGSLSAGGGPGAAFGSDGGATSSNIAEATLTLATASQRTLGSEEIARRWRDAAGDIPGVRSISFSASLAGGGDDVSLDLSHRDAAMLAAAVERLAETLRAIDGVEEIETGLDTGKRQLEFALTPAGAAAGLTSRDIALQVRQAFFGEEVQRIQRGRAEVTVYVRLPQAERRSLADLERLRIRLPDGREAALSVVADTTETLSPTSIDRVDGRRVVSVTADVDEGVTTPNLVNGLIAETVLPDLLQSHPGLDASFEGQSREQQEDVAALGGNLMIALGVIYVMLASVLRSYLQPLIVMAAIPLGAASAILGHLLMGFDLTFPSLFGVVALCGVIINGSVVLMDRYNKERAENGLDAHAAVISAAQRRFRPIVLTTLTTFLGLVPMLTETSLQAQFLIPVAISLGFGILFAGLLLIIFLPALLLIAEDCGRTTGLARRQEAVGAGHG